MDINRGVSGNESFVNGTVDNPVNNLRGAKLLSAKLGLSIKSVQLDHPLARAVREATKTEVG